MSYVHHSYTLDHDKIHCMPLQLEDSTNGSNDEVWTNVLKVQNMAVLSCLKQPPKSVKAVSTWEHRVGIVPQQHLNDNKGK